MRQDESIAQETIMTPLATAMHCQRAASAGGAGACTGASAGFWWYGYFMTGVPAAMS